MKITVLGATGATGKYVVEQALAAGHTVTALVRDAQKLPAREGLFIVEGQLANEAALNSALQGAGAVISALGVTRATVTEAPSSALPQIINAMKKHGVRRYVGISGAAVTAPGEHKAFKGRLISAVVRFFTAAVVADKQRELELLSASDLEWTLARPPRLVNGPATAAYAVSQSAPKTTKIARGDVAHFLLSEVVTPRHLRLAPYVG